MGGIYTLKYIGLRENFLRTAIELKSQLGVAGEDLEITAGEGECIYVKDKKSNPRTGTILQQNAKSLLYKVVSAENCQ